MREQRDACSGSARRVSGVAGQPRARAAPTCAFAAHVRDVFPCRRARHAAQAPAAAAERVRRAVAEVAAHRRAAVTAHRRAVTAEQVSGTARLNAAALGRGRVAARAKPAAARLLREADAGEVEPLELALGVVARDHLAVRELPAEAVHGLVRVERQTAAVVEPAADALHVKARAHLAAARGLSRVGRRGASPAAIGVPGAPAAPPPPRAARPAGTRRETVG